MSPDPFGHREAASRPDSGFVIVAVLLLMVALGALAVGMSLEAGLTTLGARSAQSSAVARSAAHAGLVMALHEITGSGAEPAARAVGPWPQLGPDVMGELSLEAGAEPPAYRIVVTASAARTAAQASAVFVLAPTFEILEWRE